VELGEETCKAAAIYGSEFWGIGTVIEKELSVASQDKKKWRFETEVFSNGYKIFQFLRRPIANPRER
jgi:hypothetical protein